ncbi:MAG: aspartate carbamoyltransferase [Clostridiales bacterium]|nr:aspartate carbamoyltransferase [Clostridiales bacterium]
MTMANKKPTEAALNTFKNRNIMDIESLSKEDLQTIMQTAAYYDQALTEKRILEDMKGKIMASLFFEPSTRTRLSFECAMERLGGKVITVSETPSMQTSSAAKGETMYDAIRVINYYCDVIACRSPIKGVRHEIARAATVPYINGGDGSGEHPTQALLDVYTIYKQKGTLDGLVHAICGDLKYGRAPHSLLDALSKFDVKKIILASPQELRMPKDHIEKIKALGIEVEECFDLDYAVENADMIYMTRVQRERFASIEEYERNRDLFIMSERHINMFCPGAIVLHPLPRVNEIEVEVDNYPGAVYFEQAGNGVPVRMALLALVTGSVV